MNITGRLLLGYFLIVSLAAWFVLRVFTEEVKPGVKQAMEETLLDTSQILAELAAADLKAGNLDKGRFSEAVKRYQEREPLAAIRGFAKHEVDLRVYITNTKGIVLYDSEGEALGQDYSKWNDVFLTLRGNYGARTTKENPDDETSGVMYVAAPVMDGSRMIGVLTAGKATLSVQPFIDRSRSRIQHAGFWLMGGALIIGLLFTWWLSHSIGKLRRYAREVGLGNKAPLPDMGGGELAELGKALAEMREKLDGREYVENYVHHLTHEMRSPLTALIGSAELLDENLPQQERAAFAASIREQGQRLKDMMEKLLALARLEQRNELAEAVPVNLGELMEKVVADHAARLKQRNLACRSQLASHAMVSGETFLLRQALSNLLDNAIDFSPDHGAIDVKLETTAGQHILTVRDQGPGIPDYALPRVFERFYSLARPGTQRKSTGLGLPFVREAALLHGGNITLENAPHGGALARLILPAA
ncbi:MAG TPA: two-component system sensor histidine kinase CreC [Gallionellaceae bacterium]